MQHFITDFERKSLGKSALKNIGNSAYSAVSTEFTNERESKGKYIAGT